MHSLQLVREGHRRGASIPCYSRLTPSRLGPGGRQAHAAEHGGLSGSGCRARRYAVHKVRTLACMLARPMAGWAGGHAWCTVHVAACTTPGALPALSVSHACMCKRGLVQRAAHRARRRSPPRAQHPAAAAAAALTVCTATARLAHCMATRRTSTAASNARGRVLPPPPGFALLQQQPSYQHFARGLPLVALSRKRRTFLHPRAV